MGFFGFGNVPGADGLTGFFSGPAAYGDSGMTGAVTPNGPDMGPAINAAMRGNLGNALGNAPPGLFSGLLPGGGMTDTQSGALGGGISGAVYGAAPIGGASMGGHSVWPYALGLAGLGLLATQGNRQQMMGGPPVSHFAFGNPSMKFALPPNQMPYMHVGT